tara:strand:+ start:321 stop:3530 length:3210 start_codon:yes stop_codon:yes gene_type:complete
MSVNLLKADKNVFDISRWEMTNATAQTIAGLGEREVVLGSGVRTEGINVAAISTGGVELKSPLFAIPTDKEFLVTGIMKVGRTLVGKVLNMKVEYFEVADTSSPILDYTGEAGNGAAWVPSSAVHKMQHTVPSGSLSTLELAVIPFSISAHKSGFRFGNPVNGKQRCWVPEKANYARIVFEVEGVTVLGILSEPSPPMFAISDVYAMSTSGVFNTKTFRDLYDILPEFIKASDADEHVATLGHHYLTKKLMASAYINSLNIGEELRKWGYTRAEDSATNTESLSTLTDPQIISEKYLAWLAQLVGVTLTNAPLGVVRWITLPEWDEETESTTWDDLDALDELTAADSALWQLLFAPTYDNISGYRQQIQYAFNGLNGGKPTAMKGYLETLLDTETPSDYFTRTKTRDRESPFLVKYVFDPTVDPDSYGTRIAEEMNATLSAGTNGSQSSKLRDAAEFAFEAKDILENNVPGAGVAKNDDTVLRFGNSACQAIPDVTGSGRHISLMGDDGINFTPKASRYGIIAGARYNTGFAFYPSSITGSGAVMKLAATNATNAGATDYIFHVADIKVGSGSSISLFKQGTTGNANHCECQIYETGTLRYHQGSGYNTQSTPYDSATHDLSYDFSQPGDRWIRISVTTTGGSGYGTTSFYVAPTMVDVLHPTNYLINTSTHATATNVYDNTATAEFFIVNHDHNGIVGYRAIINDGIADSQYAGWALSTLADLNLTEYTGTAGNAILELYDGIDAFYQDAMLNRDGSACQWTIAYEATPSPDVSEWIGLPHTGTDYLYFGNEDSSGDRLIVSGMDSDSYNWTVTYTDDTTATGSGTVTTFTWSAATYGGKMIATIDVVGTKTYSFTPSIMTTHTENTSTGTDDEGGTWTLTRVWEDSADYEFSSIIDRNLFQVGRKGGGAVSHNFAVGRDTPLSISFNYKRFKDDASADYIFHHRNINLYFNGNWVTFKVSSQFAPSYPVDPQVSIQWYDASRKGQWNHIVVVRDVASSRIILYANGTNVADAVDPTVNSLSSRTGIAEYPATFHSGDREAWQFNHFALFDEALSVTDIERVRQTLPT